MTEQPLLPSPDPAAAPESVVSKPARRDPVPWIYAVGFLILAAAILYIWQNPKVSDQTTANASALHDAEQHIASIESQLVGFHAVEQRVAAIDARVSKLEQRPEPDLGKIDAHLKALDGQASDQAQLGSRLDALSGRIESLSARDQTALDANKQRIDGLTARISGLEASASSLDMTTKRVNRLARLQEVSLALASGKPIGDLPGAPEALSRYAHSAPPTESGLRLSFAHAQQAALGAQQPDIKEAPLIDRVWDRAQGLITVRRGDSVVVGNPSATILSQAQTALEAGDLAGAVADIETLSGPPLQAMADWLKEAKSLLSARNALTNMTGQA